MKIKVSEATKEERTNLFNFLINEEKERSKNSPFEFDKNFDEIDEHLDLIQESISIQKFEIELEGFVKIIFNIISFRETELPDSEFVFENGKGVVKSNGLISKSVFHWSSFYEFEDNTFVDITRDDLIPFC